MSQKLLAEYHEVRTTSSITLNQEDGKGHASAGQTYKPGYEPKLYCVNQGRVNPSSWGINIVDAPLSGAWHVLWGPTGTPWGRAEGCNM